MMMLNVLWNDCKLYFLYLLVGGFLGVSSMIFMSGRFRFLGFCKAFFVSATVGFLAGAAAKGMNASVDFQLVAAGSFGFLGGLGGLFIVVIGATKLGWNVDNTIRDALKVRDALGDAQDAILNGCSDEDAPIDYCVGQPVENGILMVLVRMGLLTDRQAKNVCEGQGAALLAELHKDGNLTNDQHERLRVAFFVRLKQSKKVKKNAAQRAIDRQQLQDSESGREK